MICQVTDVCGQVYQGPHLDKTLDLDGTSAHQEEKIFDSDRRRAPVRGHLRSSDDDFRHLLLADLLDEGRGLGFRAPAVSESEQHALEEPTTRVVPGCLTS